jgi:hypothetical protein
MVARHLGFKRLISPEGNLTIAALTSWLIKVALTPLALTNFPPSPGLASMLQTGRPSGISERGKVFPDFISAEIPIAMESPTAMPSGART